MTLLIDGQRLTFPNTTHSYLSVLLGDQRIPLPFTEFWVLLLLSSRLLQGIPKVHSKEIWGLLTNRYMYRCKEMYQAKGIPCEIVNTRDFCYQIRFPNEIDVQIGSVLLLDQDARVREEVKKYLYATQGVASVA